MLVYPRIQKNTLFCGSLTCMYRVREGLSFCNNKAGWVLETSSVHHLCALERPTYRQSQWNSGSSSTDSLEEEEQKLILVLDACDGPNQLKLAHAHILRKGLDQSSFVLAKLLRMFTKHGIPMLHYQRLLFERVRHPNAFLWTALIRGYSLLGPFPEAILMYNRMRELGAPPISFTFSSLFKACSAMAALPEGKQIHANTLAIGFNSDLFVHNALIDMYVKCGCLDDARQVFDEMPIRDVISWTSLIVAYAKSGDMEPARRLFDDLPQKDMVAWTAMVTGYAQNAKPKEALNLFERMRAASVKTDEVSLVGAVSACAQLGALRRAQWVHDIAERNGLELNVVVGSALIDMYAKCGSVKKAYQMFEKMTERNVYSYSAMIVGFAMHGQAEAAIRLFSEMQETEIKPNGVTFIGVLTACSHAGLVEQGCHCFWSMSDDYGINPSVDHYACMVDMLGRAGRVEEALGLVQTMPEAPHGGVWGALLGACRIHGNANIAEIAATHLFELEPDGIGNYVLLSNIYAAAGRWEDVSRVRKLMREKRLRKNPGCSWVEGRDGAVHEFFAGDSSHPRSKEIEAVLEGLLERLKKEMGHVPNLSSVLYDVSDADKERLLKRHSEKLALAFGLMISGPGATVRIVKNLRMCEDCHSVMRAASGVARRAIVVRDNMRFHHFEGGTCSCRDFW